MGSLHWSPEDYEAFLKRKAEFDAKAAAEGRVKTVKSFDEPEPKPVKVAKPPRKKRLPKLSDMLKVPVGVRALLTQIEQQALPTPILEHRFHPERKWRFDLAWEAKLLAVEVDGAVWTQGRHSRGGGMEKDNEKLNAAQMLGWKVFRYSTGQVKQGAAIADLKAALA